MKLGQQWAVLLVAGFNLMWGRPLLANSLWLTLPKATPTTTLNGSHIEEATSGVNLKSGYIPKDCRFLQMTGSPFLMDCWLKNTPAVSSNIFWMDHRRHGFAWSAWEDWRKADLRKAYLEATQWHADGMGNFPGTFETVPVNQEEPWIETSSFTVFDDNTQAWPIYIAHLAFSLAAEINAWVPWSLRSYDQEALLDLLSSKNMFMYSGTDFYKTTYQGYVLMGYSTPTHPSVTFKFLANNNLIASSSRATLAKLLEWSRTNLVHFAGSANPEDQEQYWQYKGAPPMARVLEGTVSTDPSVRKLVTETG